MNLVFKEDNYSKARGKYSRIVDIYCRKCKKHVCYYQKDGGTKNYSGQFRRLYVDRFLDNNSKLLKENELKCLGCDEILGIKINYSKENRSAFRLFVGAIKNKVVKIKKT